MKEMNQANLQQILSDKKKIQQVAGSPDAKAAAKLITDKGVEEDGWADFVEKHILAQ